jgi:hypothetical protein
MKKKIYTELFSNMRVLLKIVCFSFLSFAFIRCKKDIKEPTNFGNGKTKLYIKVDDTEYLFEDKVINLNKNVGSDLVIKEVDIEHNALGIYIEFSLHNKLLKDKKKSYYYSTNGYINIDPEGRWISDNTYEWDMTDQLNKEEEYKPDWIDHIIDKTHDIRYAI